MLADTEAKVAGLGEVALPQFVFLDLEATFQDFLGLGATHSDVHRDLFVTTDTKGTDGVAGLAWTISVSFFPSHFEIHFPVFVVWVFHTVDRGLTAQLFEHLCSTGESVTRFADRDVKHELLDAQLAHRVGALVISFRLHLVREIENRKIDD